MVPLFSLWLPVLLAAVLVFIASSAIHMLLPRYHFGDFSRAPGEEAVLDALRAARIPPGEYMLPHAGSPERMCTPEYHEKIKHGPAAFMTVMPGDLGMGKSLALWFVYCVVVGLFAAYVAGRALGPGAPFLSVFRFASCTAFAGYVLALWQNVIWYHRRLSTTLKFSLDGLVYALLTGATFGLLWPA